MVIEAHTEFLYWLRKGCLESGSTLRGKIILDEKADNSSICARVPAKPAFHSTRMEENTPFSNVHGAHTHGFWSAALLGADSSSKMGFNPLKA
jgi:hypothetical protein